MGPASSLWTSGRVRACWCCACVSAECVPHCRAYNICYFPYSTRDLFWERLHHLCVRARASAPGALRASPRWRDADEAVRECYVIRCWAYVRMWTRRSAVSANPASFRWSWAECGNKRQHNNSDDTQRTRNVVVSEQFVRATRGCGIAKALWIKSRYALGRYGPFDSPQVSLRNMFSR